MNDKIFDKDNKLDSIKLANKLLRLVGVLHQRGYESLYFHSGMSPSGVYWRYHILTNEKELLRDSLVGDLPKFDWVKNWDDNIEIWADDFIKFYQNDLTVARQPNIEYVTWYENILNIIGDSGYLILENNYNALAHCSVSSESIPIEFPTLAYEKYKSLRYTS